MTISMRAQVLAICGLMLVPAGFLVWLSSRATFREQTTSLAEDARRAAVLLGADLAPVRADDLAAIEGLVQRLAAALPPGSVASVVDRSGRLLAGSVMPSGDAVIETHDVPGRDWRVHVAVPLTVAWARTWPIYRRSMRIVIGVATTTVIVIFMVARRWRRAISALERQAGRVGSGDLSQEPRPAMPTSELENLQRSFTEMVENLQSLERQVIRQERLAAIGMLVSGIAHELNNPLQAIAGFAQLLQRDTALSDRARADLALIQKESARASAIIRNLSRFGRQETPEPQLVLMADVVASVVELRQRRFDELGIALALDQQSQMPVLGVFSEFQQVLLNFVVNAEQAIDQANSPMRRITLSTRDAAGRVVVEVEDSGPGVPVDHEAKLFQPFFTTKAVGDGTGLGLSVSYGIIRSSGGAIGHRRAATGGAVFYFDVPAAGAPPAS